LQRQERQERPERPKEEAGIRARGKGY